MRKLLPLLLLVGCTSPPTAKSLLTPTSVTDEVFADASIAPLATVRQPPGLADVAGGLPVVAAYRTLPLAGEPFVVAWTTRPSPTYPEGPLGPGRYPNVPTALLVSTEPIDTPVLLPGSKGAYLQVGIGRPSDFTLTPKSGTFLTQDNGTVHFQITWPKSARGSRWFMQLVVADSRTPIGVTLSPLFEIIVGTQ